MLFVNKYYSARNDDFERFRLNLTKTNVLSYKLKMKLRSLFVFGMILLCSFGGFIAVTIFSNLKLQDLHSAQYQSSHLLLSWEKCQNLTKELLITYDLIETRKKWLKVNHQFERDFFEFIESSVTLEFAKNDVNFQTQVDMAKMRRQVILKRIQEADKTLGLYIFSIKGKPYSGNPLVDFGENLAKMTLTDDLMDLLKELRWLTSLSPFAFTEELNRINQYVNGNVTIQTNRLRVNALLLSVFILGITGLFIVYRMVEITRSRETAHKHAAELSTEIEVRKHAEEMLLSERDKLGGVLNAMGEGMYIVNKDFVIEYQNKILQERFGDLVGKKCYAKYMKSNKPCTFCLSRKTMASEKMRHTEAIFSDGRNLDLVFSPFSDVDGATKVIVLVRDITEKKSFEAEVMRAAHLASIGELAAGVAHEINNPINGIINYAERLEDLYGKTRNDSQIPGRIIKEGDRIAQIVRNLLSFARVQKEEPITADIKDILEDALGLAKQQMANSGITICLDLAPELSMIKVRSKEIQQVFMNVFSNARYALNKKFLNPDKDKLLEIKGYEVKVNEEAFIRVTFKDMGTGIPLEVIDKICNPFFTTKPKGEGTGLGLSISHGIIKSHGGNITFKSIPGEYSIVTIDFPVDKNS
jgi:signal transduction histidine kinase